MPTSPYIYDPSVISAWKIGNVAFNTAPIWVDKLKVTQQVGSLHHCIGGQSVMQIFPKDLSGLPITLKLTGYEGVISADRVADLQALCDAGDTVQFTDGDVTIDVVFDYSKENPIDLEYLDGNKVLMTGTIYLIRV